MGKPEMRAVDVNSNLKNWPAWEYKDYRLGQKEAKCCTDALDNYIWHSVDKQGMPSKPGTYLMKDYEDYYSTFIIFGDYRDDDIDEFTSEFKYWRKIIDNENSYMEEMR